MPRNIIVLLLTVLLLATALGGVSAETDDWGVGANEVTVTFEPNDDDTVVETVQVTNNDENESVELEASVTGQHEVVGQPGVLGPGETADIIVEATANDPGEATLEVTGGGASESIPFVVQTPAYLDVFNIPDWVEDDGVLPGETRTAEVTIEEIGGYEGFEGIDIEDEFGGLDLSNLEFTSLGPMERTTVEIEVSADEDDNVREIIGGTVPLNPDDGFDVESEVDIESSVAAPPQFARLDFAEDEFPFDEPRERGTISREAVFEVQNGGDRELDLESVSFESDTFDISVTQQPDVIDPGVTDEVTVELTAGTDTDQGRYDISAAVSAADFESEEGSEFEVENGEFDGDIFVRHEIEMGVSPSRVSFGDIPIGDRDTTSNTVSEELGYQDIENADLTLVDGTDEFITVANDLDTSIDAGSSSQLQFDVEFDPNADIGTEYTWTYQADGDGVEAQEITVTATPIPLNLDPILNDLETAPEGSEGLDQIASETRILVNEMDERIRADDVPQEDITTVLTFGDGIIRYMEAVDATEQLIADGNHNEAQDELVQAAVAFDTISTYGGAVRDDDLRNRAETVEEAASSELESLLETQENHYEQQLANENVSRIDEATIQRELARVATLQGDTERADELENNADAAFETYSELVAEGETEYQNAEQTWEQMESDIFVSVLGTDIIVNPTRFDAFEAQADELLASYDGAEAAFTEAGETNRAETIAAERDERASALTIARWSLFASIVLTTLLLLLLVAYTIRGMYWYVQDARKSVTGEFMV